MPWKKINSAVSMWEKPALGTTDQKDGKRYMALCIDPSSKNPYRGIARQVFFRKGDVNTPSYFDRSMLVTVKSEDLMTWEIIKELGIKGIIEDIRKLAYKTKYNKDFLGIEDPDIVQEENGKKGTFFTIAFKYKDIHGYEVYLAHAVGKSLEHLKAKALTVENTPPKDIRGFKEICPIPTKINGKRFMLAETFISKIGSGRSGIGLLKFENSKRWKFIKLVHDPRKERKYWCSGDSSPCRFFNPKFLDHKGLLVGIMNACDPSGKENKNKRFEKFGPGLFLFDPKKLEIVWVANNWLFSDPFSTGITFASELITLNKKEALLYAHVNDSFVRVYKLNLDEIRKMLPEKI